MTNVGLTFFNGIGELIPLAPVAAAATAAAAAAAAACAAAVPGGDCDKSGGGSPPALGLTVPSAGLPITP